VINAILWKLRTGAPRRDLATRYAKRAAYYQAGPTIAAVIRWLR
jgi:transposase